MRYSPSKRNPIKNFSHFFRTGHRIAPKFCTHVWTDTLTLKKFDPPHPRGGGLSEPNPDVCGLFTYLFRDTTKFGMHVRIDTLTLKKINNLTHPTPGGFRVLYIVKNLSRRIAPKFGTHVRIDTLTLKKITILTHPTPGGFRGLYIV